VFDVSVKKNARRRLALGMQEIMDVYDELA